MNIISKSIKHCTDSNENYFKHMNVAIKIALNLLLASIMAFIHAIIPAFFEKGASKKIITLHNYLKKKNRINHEN